ncbi:MAG: calcium/sodium antiporter [Alistipes sp.]|nr:calcium/sodium antiporter [Alistipes sp.]MBO7281968.1 calcium/sodium antiporter [Alistipes sp.]
MEYLILISSLAGIVFGADFLVAGAVSVARRFKVSDFVIGAAIVGVGTSMPELVVSFLGALGGNADVAIGNVVGSNIFNVLGILGLTALFFPVAIGRKESKFEIPLCIGVSLLLMVLVFNFFNGTPAVISRVDGIVLLLLFALFMWYSFSRDRKSATEQTSNSEESTPLWLAVVKIIGGLALLITSCDLFVDNAVLIAKSFGVNDAFISLTLIACGTSLPELAASIAAAVKKNTSLALGNIVGSNIFNITLILGLSSQVMPLNSTGITTVDYAVMIAAAFIPLLFGLRGKIGRVGGAMMFICFVAYNWYLISNQII